MAEVNSNGLMVQLMRVNLWIIIFTVKEYISGLTIDVMKANGKTIKCMDKEFSLGLTEENMKEIISMTRNKAMVCLHGQMEESTMDSG